MKNMSILLGVAGLGLAICGCTTVRTDDEGFAYLSVPDVEDAAPSDYYVIRYEYPSGPEATVKWQAGLQRRNFVELRQLKDSVTQVTDGKFATLRKRHPGRNWRKWLHWGARNVRIKFVGPDYSLAADGRAETPEGFTRLFDGQSLDGWKGVTREEKFNLPETRRAAWPEKLWEIQAKADKLMREHWHVRDGALFFDGLEGGYSLATKKDYRNFELIADWRLLRVFGDSGFYLRGMPQVQIWDPEMWSGQGSGSIWNNAEAQSMALVRADNPIGDWNRCRMRLVGDRVSVWLNGRLVVDNVRYENCRDPKKTIPLVDQIELQCHGDPVEFRNIFIKELPEAPEDVPNPAAAVRGATVDLLKDGLAGWTATDPKARMGWSVKDGVLSNFVTDDPESRSRGGSGGTHLQTKRADFFDFDLSYDVLVPAKCNSGVYLRGRYEIQVCDSYGRKPDCHNMAALYDLLTPTAAAEKPAGEWQHVDLTLYRRFLTVRLNGVTIIDNQPIAGVTPAALDGDEYVPGPILLQGDHSNASFRNMRLTPILK